MMTAIRGVKWTSRAVAVAAWLGAAWYLVTWEPSGLTAMVLTAVATTYLGWVVMPAQEDMQRILGRIHELDNRPRQTNDRYGWETRR